MDRPIDPVRLSDRLITREGDRGLSAFEFIYLGIVLGIVAVGMIGNTVIATFEKKGLRRR